MIYLTLLKSCCIESYRVTHALHTALFLAFILSHYALSHYALAESPRLFSFEGTVTHRAANSSDWQTVTGSLELTPGAVIRTGHLSRAGILLEEGIVIRLNQNSEVALPGADTNPTLTVDHGDAFFFSRKPRRYPTINTPNVSAAVRGTEFALQVRAGETRLSLIDGAVAIGSNEITAGTVAIVTAAGLREERLLRPLDAVQWALSYPAIISVADLDWIASEIKARTEIISAINALHTGAVAPSQQLNARNSTPLSQLLNAAAALTRGDTSALKALNKNNTFQNNSSLRAAFLTLQSVAALTENRFEESQAFLSEGFALEPNLPALKLAQSYLAQANRNLSHATRLAEELVTTHPTSEIARARLAELRLASGDFEEAEILLANTNSIIFPKTLALKGFAELYRYEYTAAENTFNDLITRYSTEPSGYFGKGLLRIHYGDLAGGRIALQAAAALAPSLSIYRSYLGKTFFEARDETFAGLEFDRAIALDPLDPTPYYYRAFNHLALNALPDALTDIEASISRNENRAVYRSTALIDRDTAARSAGLAEIFRELGFHKAAEVEAIKSINLDYTNFSAHKLLSESSRSIQQSDASLSERSITELMAPLSLNLVNTPAVAPGLNDYNALFDRVMQRTRFGFEGSTYHDLWLPEAFHAGRTENSAYSFGVQAASTEGGREEDYGRDYRLQGSFRYQLSPRDRIGLSGRYQNIDMNDRNVLTFADREFERRALNEGYNATLGYTHEFSRRALFLQQLSMRDLRSYFRNPSDRDLVVEEVLGFEEPPFAEATLFDESLREDLRDLRYSPQFAWDSDLFSLVAGGEMYHASSKRSDESTIIADEFGLFAMDQQVGSMSDLNLDSQSIYLYPTAHVTKWLDLTIGAAYTNLEYERFTVAPVIDAQRSVNRWSPKIGATLYLSSALTVRSAYFESVRKAFIEDSGSIEPTLIGGQNQLFTDFPASASRNYSFGVDYKVAAASYLGASYLHRNMIEPNSVATSVGTFDPETGSFTTNAFEVVDSELHREQDFVSSYWYQVLSRQLVSSVDYTYSRSKYTDPLINQAIGLHQTGIGLRYFSRTGFFANVTTNWYQQDRTGSFFNEDGVSDFWLCNTAVGYRLPHQQGAVTLHLRNIFDKNFDLDQSLGFDEVIVPAFTGSLQFSVNF
jgi:hypothetical protein